MCLQCSAFRKKMCFQVTRWHFQFRFTVLLPRCCNTLSFLVIWASKAMIYNRYNELITHLVAVLLRNLLLTHHHHIPVTWPRKARRTATPQWGQTLFEFAFSCNFTSCFSYILKEERPFERSISQTFWLCQIFVF